MRFIYSKKTKEEIEVNAEEIFNQLMEKILEYSDVSWALFDLMRQGFNLSLSGVKVRGLDDLLKRLEDYKTRLEQKYNMTNALDEVAQKLQNLLEEEWKTLKENIHRFPSKKEKYEEKEKFLLGLPSSLTKAIEKLEQYKFENKESKEKYEDLKKYIDSIKKLENKIIRKGKNIGEDKISFQEAIKIFNKLDLIDQTINALKKGNIEDVNVEIIKEALGVEGAVDIKTIHRAVKKLFEENYITNSQNNEITLTPKSIRKIGEKALADIYKNIRGEGLVGRHPSTNSGSGEIMFYSSVPLKEKEFKGIDVVGTLKNAVFAIPCRNKLMLEKEDFMVFEEEKKTSCATAILLDLSWSMSWGGKFQSAKKVALALEHLIKTQYPKDNLYIIGFYTVATLIKPKDLPLIDLSISDPFTNIQDSLRLASKMLLRDGSKNKQIILITDGQPTAYFENDILQVEWPVFGISPFSFKATLKEVKRVTSLGIKINTFMLDSSPSLINFVEEMTRINRGKAFFTTPKNLGSYVVSDYVAGRKKILH